jgi:4-amino-4-deoxy-L-arabinose transferase-like glycosyltransferase
LKVALLSAIVALVVAQGLVIGRVELTFDEAYYVMWARWPQAGYYDHPPLVAWAILASQSLFGRGEFGVRALFWLAGASLPALVAWIGWRLYEDAATGVAAGLILLGAPLLAGAPLATPDTPLTLFWTLALAGIAEVWRGRPWAWGVVGLATGAAGLAKLTAGFLGLGIALALMATPSLRGQFRRPGPWLAAVLALLVVSPFLIWNYDHGYATLLKQGGRIGARGFAPRYLAEFVGAQLALFNPLTAAAVLWAARRGRDAPSEPTRLLLATVAPALAYFVLHALHDRVQGNWPAPLYPALALLAARATRTLRWAPPAAAALGLAATAAAYLHLATEWPRLGPSDPLLRIGGWRELSAETFAAARARSAGFVLAQGYAATSLLSFYGPSAPPVIEAGEPQRWTFRPPVDTRGPGLAFGPPAFAATLGRLYARVTPVETLRRRVGGVELEPYVLFTVEGAAP